MRLSDQQITLSQLENHLWESANILRGPVDAADFKTYGNSEEPVMSTGGGRGLES